MLSLSSVGAGVKVLRLALSRTMSGGSKKLDLSGIFPALPTPFNQDESIAYDKLESNFRHWNNIPFTGYLIHGSNGEYQLMTLEERVEMMRRVKALTPENKIIIAGSSSESTAQTIEMSKLIADAGADCVMLLPPHYFKSSMSEEVLAQYYTTVADNIPVPVLMYNNVGNTGIDMSASLVTRLASHPNIAGIKDSSADLMKIATVVKDTKHLDFKVLIASIGVLLPGLSVGCSGGLVSMANILGNEVCQLYELFKESKLSEATELQQRFLTPNTTISKVLGVPGMKAAVDYVGLYGGPCRRPFLPLTKDQVSLVHQAFKASGFLPKQ